MKKNLISILILALLVVNVVLTGIMMFSIMGATKKTSALVNNIATVLNLELDSDKGAAEEDTTVSISDSVAHDIADTLTIPLKKDDDGKTHYYIVNVSLYMNSKHEDYETYGATIANNDSLFKSIIIDIIGSHTLSEAQSGSEALRNEILTRIQQEYNSTFIYKVTFSNIMYQ